MRDSRYLFERLSDLYAKISYAVGMSQGEGFSRKDCQGRHPFCIQTQSQLEPNP